MFVCVFSCVIAHVNATSPRLHPLHRRMIRAGGMSVIIMWQNKNTRTKHTSTTGRTTLHEHQTWTRWQRLTVLSSSGVSMLAVVFARPQGADCVSFYLD